MSRIIITEFLTLDGVMEDPGGAEGFERGGWAFQFDRGPEGDEFKLGEILEAGASLLGRVTYQGFAEAWPSRTGEFADKINAMPKYVVSTTLSQDELEWKNSILIAGDVVGQLSSLKQQVDGDMLVAGSGQLVQTLLEHDLVDELRLMVFPILLGAGKRLFAEDGPTLALQLAEARTVGDGVLILVYRRATR
jgi:dihydrofolate reductase